MTDQQRHPRNSESTKSARHSRDSQRRRREILRRRKKIKLIRTSILLFIIIIATIIACIVFAKISKSKKTEKLEAQQQAMEAQQQAYLNELTDEQNTRAENKIRIVAVGDNLIHERIYESGIDSNGNYSYEHLYTHIKDDIASADIAIVNEEGIFVKDHNDVSAYPTFGTPTEVGDALVDTGFDVVQHASNHAYDKGTAAITDTISYWKDNHPDIKMLGIHDSQKSADTISTISCKGVTFALLNYTSQLNVDADENLPSYMIDTLTFEKIEKDIKKAKEISDMTIALLHVGEEYANEPNKDQMDFLKYFLYAGVDIAICSHPHVLQNFETMRDENGNEMLIYYSLGNFISTQKEPNCLLGGMADITLTKDPTTGEFSISDAAMIPLVTHYDYDTDEYAVYKLEDYSEELAAKHSIHEETDDEFTLEWLNERYDTILGEYYDTLGD